MPRDDLVGEAAVVVDGFFDDQVRPTVHIEIVLPSIHDGSIFSNDFHDNPYTPMRHSVFECPKGNTIFMLTPSIIKKIMR